MVLAAKETLRNMKNEMNPYSAGSSHSQGEPTYMHFIMFCFAPN